MLTVNYEDLVTDPSSTLRSVCAHCDVVYESNVIGK